MRILRLLAVVMAGLLSTTFVDAQTPVNCDVGSVPSDLGVMGAPGVLTINLGDDCSSCSPGFGEGAGGCAVIKFEASYISGCTSMMIEVEAQQNEIISYYYSKSSPNCGAPDAQTSQSLGTMVAIESGQLETDSDGNGYLLVCSQSTGNRKFRFICLCPDLTADAPAIVISSESSCDEAGGTPTGGELSVPLTQCPDGSTLEYSVNDGPWTITLPVYDQINTMMIRSRCLCTTDTDESSPITTVVTNPGSCPDPECPDFTNLTTPEVIIESESECNSFTTPDHRGGLLAVPNSLCPDGSTLQYSLNGTPWVMVLPVYDQDEAITIMTRCNCNDNRDISSSVASITTNPGPCPPCPDGLAAVVAPVVQFTDSSCSSSGTTTDGTVSEPSTSCPDGSTIQYAINDGPWTSILPDYNPEMSIRISTRCNCDEDESISSITGEIVTSPMPCIIPTMSQWMLFILGLIILSIGLVFIRQSTLANNS